MKKCKKTLWGIIICGFLMTAMIIPAMASGNIDSAPAEDSATTIDTENMEGIEDAAEFNSVITENLNEPENYSDDITPDEGEDEDGEPDDPVGPGPELEDVTVTAAQSTLNVVGQTTQLTYSTTPEGMEVEDVTWSSSNEKIATVDSTGLVTAVGNDNGATTATITAYVTYNGAEYPGSCTVKVSLYNGVYQEPGGTDKYYYQNGVIANITDVKKINGTWYNLVKGKVVGNTVAKNSNGWWYINANGVVDFNYTGFGSNSNGKWYCESGKVTFNKNSVLKDTTGAIGTKGNWYYVVGSKVQTSYTGVANYKNSNGWWYIKKGQVDFTANTVAKNNNGWWYVKNGKVNFSYNGFASNSNGKWYCENGKVTFKKNSVIKDSSGAIGTKGTWYYVVGSKVQTNFTGLANYSNSNGWWYIKNGKVDFTHNGVDKNKNGWYYVTGGKVQFGFTGLANYSNSNGWWYINKGKVNFNASGVYKNKNGWWYVNNGKVNFSFNGLASNSNGMWVIKNGKVDFSYNGTYTYSGTTYNVKDGKVSQPSNTIGMGSSMFNKAQSQSSSTKWLILVDVSNCKLGVFQGAKGYWTPVKYWTCSTGASATPTVRGTYSITSKGKSFGDGYTCWYYNQFYGNYLIHSILYNQGSQTSVQDGRLGMHVSHGCVRLALTNAKWIYDNVPIGTRVLTY